MSHVGRWSRKNEKKSSRYASFTLCWVMTLRKETEDARLNLFLTYYVCPVKKEWPLLNYTHQKSPEEESPCRSSELAKQFPRLRRRNASSLTFEKLFVWLKNKGKTPPPSESVVCRDKFVNILMTTSFFHTPWTVSATTLVKTFAISRL